MEKSFPFNSINRDRLYSADDWRSYFATLIGNGVFPNPSTGLHIISNNNMTISILEGKGYINGAIYHNTDNLILPIDPADGTLNRIDRIVMRFDTLDRIIKCKVKKGTFATNPVAPTLQRDADAYELCIAEIRIDKGITSILQSKITDTRLNSELCGIVTQTVKTIDTTTLFKKLEAYIDERGQDVDGWVDEATTRWERDFISWFNTIKDVLDGDIAGALANRILELENVVNNLELTSTKVMRPNQKTVEQSLSDNETSIQSLQNELGDLKQLQTTNKANLVGAINELFLNANNGKTTIANAIGSPLLSSDSFATMGTKITNDLEARFKTNLNAKGVTTVAGDKISSLIDKVGTIPLGKKYASGTSIIKGESAGTFITIPALAFKATVIIATTSSNIPLFAIHNSNVSISGNYNSICDAAWANGILGYNLTVASGQQIKLKVSTTNSSRSDTFNWYAFE